MSYTTFEYKVESNIANITLNRVKQKNSLSIELITELIMLLKIIDSDINIKIIVIRSLGNVFCSGMDLNQASGKDNTIADSAAESFFDLLIKLTLSPKIIISLIEGRVNAGGVGLISACDINIASKLSSFSLSEALFGLIPANILPFVIKRIGFQKAYYMSITTNVINSEEAMRYGLIDELSNEPELVLRKQLSRLLKVDTEAIRRLKNYAYTLCHINNNTKKEALKQISEMNDDSRIKENINNFIERGINPWEK